MPTLEFPIRAPFSASDLYTGLIAILDRFALASAKAELGRWQRWENSEGSFIQLSEDDKRREIEAAQSMVDAGGTYEVGPGSAVSSEGLHYEWMSAPSEYLSGELPPGLLSSGLRLLNVEGYEQVRFRISPKPETGSDAKVTLGLTVDGTRSRVSLEGDTDTLLEIRAEVEAAINTSIDVGALMETTFRVFIGHGRDPQWQYLKMRLENDGIRIAAFESEPRVSRLTLAVVDEMIRESDLGIIVMTGEDQLQDGTFRARENVIHEMGYCHGALGLDRTMVLLEEGVQEPSNIAGYTQIRFGRGRIVDAFDEVVEVIELRRKAAAYIGN